MAGHPPQHVPMPPYLQTPCRISPLLQGLRLAVQQLGATNLSVHPPRCEVSMTLRSDDATLVITYINHLSAPERRREELSSRLLRILPCVRNSVRYTDYCITYQHSDSPSPGPAVSGARVRGASRPAGPRVGRTPRVSALRLSARSRWVAGRRPARARSRVRGEGVFIALVPPG